MRRDPKTGLVKNEVLLLVSIAEHTDGVPLYPYALTRYWKQNPIARSLPYSTLYRCLDELEQRGFVVSEYADQPTDGPVRRRYALTPLGRALAERLVNTVDERLVIPHPA